MALPTADRLSLMRSVSTRPKLFCKKLSIPRSFARFEGVSQRVAEQIATEHCHRNGDARPSGEPRIFAEIVFGLGQHAAPFGLGWVSADAQKRKTRHSQNGAADEQTCQHNRGA